MPAEGNIIIRRAKVNNLKNITVEIPRNRLVVVTGISGSGKSSLAFDTLFAEGQRRFAESLSSYARQFLGRMSKPDVEMIEGIPPAIAIEQKVNIRNPRSTVATTTEIYDFLRLLFARIGRTYSPVSGEEVKADTVQDVLRTIFDGAAHTVYVLSDIRWKDRSDKVELMLALKEEGYGRLFDLDTQQVHRIEDVMQMDGHYPENLFLLVDRAKTRGETDEDLRTRLLSSIQTAFDKGEGDMVLMIDGAPEDTDPSASLRDPIRANAPGSVPSGALHAIHFCSRFERDGMTFRVPDEYLFSFNSPLGACPECGGLGKIIGVSEDLVVPDKTKTIYDSAVACWRGDKMSWFKDLVVKNAQKYD
ncbi:MAG: excinuclease ABC subunit A, partial [Bacteroidales bacterium]|nr:excinuclease ABC subunit A [Bacteroidales bacterium]